MLEYKTNDQKIVSRILNLNVLFCGPRSSFSISSTRDSQETGFHVQKVAVHYKDLFGGRFQTNISGLCDVVISRAEEESIIAVCFE